MHKKGYTIEVCVDARVETWALHKWTPVIEEAHAHANKLKAQGWSVRVIDSETSEPVVVHMLRNTGVGLHSHNDRNP